MYPNNPKEEITKLQKTIEIVKNDKRNKTDYNESWEEATIEDLETGKYEII